jgi:VCBS repeat-containing protein
MRAYPVNSNRFRIIWATRTTAFAFALVVIVALFLALMASPAHAAGFTVTNTNDSGPGSLRQAIESANDKVNFPGHDTILFDIPGNGPHTIAPSSPLPTITDPVTIDGYTQGDSTATTDDDATENTLARGTNAVLKIELNFANASNQGSGGLTVAANGSTVRGLVINRSENNGIVLGALGCTPGNNTVVEGNFIGTNPAGTAAGPGNRLFGVSMCSKNNIIGGTTPDKRNLISGNGNVGIKIDSNTYAAQGNRIEGNLIGTNAEGTDDVANLYGVRIGDLAGGNIIGGTTAASRNVISGNSQNGIELGGDTINFAPGDTIQGNYIGTNAAGSSAVPNGGNGLVITHANNNNIIGGTAAGEGNLISGNGGVGVSIGSTGNTVRGNLIGLKADGTGSLGNGQPNIVGSGAGIQVGGSNNTIGGTDTGAGNTIANNFGPGVLLSDLSSEGNAILGNSIFSNTRLGIDLSEGSLGVTLNDSGDYDNFVANRGQNFPLITPNSVSVSGGNATFSGTLNSNPDATFRLEFFANESCNAAAPGFPGEEFFGEGQTFIGTTDITTDDSGNTSFGPLTFPVPSGQSVITATATNTTTNNTSEFSQCESATINSSPTATDDLYSTNQDTALNQPVPGVLANDSDPENDTLTALEFDGPSHGTLTLNPNGSFTYAPDAGFSSTDSFTYKANDGTADSNIATVNITVKPVDTTAPAVFGVDPSDGQTGVSTTTNITLTFSEKMDESTLNDNTVKFVKPGKRSATLIPVTMTKRTDGSGRSVLTLDPYGSARQKLAGSTTYQLAIEGAGDGDNFAVKDLAGNALARDTASSFTTARK